MGRPPVPDSLAGERGAGDLPAVPAGRRGGTSASAEQEFRCISRRGNPCRTGAADGRRYQIPEQTGEGHQISTRRLGSLKTSRWM